MKWLITGGCGFIGRNLLFSLLKERNHAIRIVDNLSVGSRDDLLMVSPFSELEASKTSWENFPDNGEVQLVVDDILNAGHALQHSNGADVIVHLAANTGVGPSVEDPRGDCTTNVIGTFNYLEAARYNDVGRFIYASSGAPLGEVEPPIHEELAPHPVSPYGASKLAGEGYCSAYYGSFNVETVVLRFGNVYGPFSTHKSSVVAKFIRQVINGETLEIYGDGKQTRDFIFSVDLVNAIYKASIIENIGGEIFQIASNNEITILELTQRLSYLFKNYGYSNININFGNKRRGDVMRNYSDTKKARKVMNWRNNYNLDKGLYNTINWFLNIT